jgi:uncharacterized protein
MRALVTGATGFVGRRLLGKLDHPIVLSRNPQRAREELMDYPVTVHGWNPTEEPAPAEAFEGVDVVFHLAGESIADGRWTAAKKQRLHDSRVLGTRNLVAALLKTGQAPAPVAFPKTGLSSGVHDSEPVSVSRVLVSASAIGYYGDRGEQELRESAAPGEGFLPDLCVAWEREAREAESAGVRVVSPRIGLVLNPGGGALGKMLPLFRAGLASPLGNGRQYMSWIHIDDLIRLLLFAAEHGNVAGPVNATAPHPVTNRDFTRILAKVLHRPALLPPVPKFALRLSMGEFANVLFESQRVIPAAAEQYGFQFQHPELEQALKHLLA